MVVMLCSIIYIQSALKLSCTFSKTETKETATILAQFKFRMMHRITTTMCLQFVTYFVSNNFSNKIIN